MPLKTHLEVAKYSNLSPRSGFSVQWPSYSLIVSTVSKYKKVKYHVLDNGQWMFFWVQTWAWLNGAHWVNLVGWKRYICPAWSCWPPGSGANTIAVSALCAKLNDRALGCAGCWVTADSKPGWGWHRLSCSAEYPQRLPVKLRLAKEWPEPRGITVILAEVLPAAFPLLIT